MVALESSPPTTARLPSGSTKIDEPCSRVMAPVALTSAGIPRARQMMAVWDVGPPSSVMTPTTDSPNCDVSNGVRSSATIIQVPSAGMPGPAARPRIHAEIRAAMPRRSATRDWKSSSSPMSSANSSRALNKLVGASAPDSRWGRAISWSSGSSKMIRRASRISWVVASPEDASSRMVAAVVAMAVPRMLASSLGV